MKTCNNQKIKSYKLQRDALNGNKTGASERKNNPTTVHETSFVEGSSNENYDENLPSEFLPAHEPESENECASLENETIRITETIQEPSMPGKFYDGGLLPIGNLFKLITSQSTDID